MPRRTHPNETVTQRWRAARVACLLLALGLAGAAWAQGKLPSASSTDDNSAFGPEYSTTTTSVGNPDGSRTVTTTDADGNVIEQHTVPAEPAAPNATLEEVQAEIERQAAEDAEWLQGWDEDFADVPDDGDRGAPADPDDPQHAVDALLDTEERIEDLRNEHNALLDQAGATEDLAAFQALVDQAQQVFEQLNTLQESYDDQYMDLVNPDGADGPLIDLNAMGDEIEALEDLLEGLNDAVDRAETDEEAEALEAEAAETETRLRALQDEYHQIFEESRPDPAALPQMPGTHVPRINPLQSTPTPPSVPTHPSPPHRPPY